MSRIRVLVVDDSEICGELLTAQLEADGDIEVVDTASSGLAALTKLARANPDVVTVDLNMPGMNGLALIEQIMSRDPRPIIVVTGLDAHERDLAVAATARGALELVNKRGAGDLEASAALRASVRRLAGVAVGRIPTTPRGATLGSSWPPPRAANRHVTPIVGFGSSAGGPKPLFDILDALPPTCPATTAVAHHLPPDFAAAFARLLRSQVHFGIRVADAPVDPTPGTWWCRPPAAIWRSRPVGSWPPSCHRVAAVSARRRVVEPLAAAPGAHVGVVLSGLGDDGGPRARGHARGRQADNRPGPRQRCRCLGHATRAALPSALEALDTSEIASAITRWLAQRTRRNAELQR